MFEKWLVSFLLDEMVKDRKSIKDTGFFFFVVLRVLVYVVFGRKVFVVAFIFLGTGFE